MRADAVAVGELQFAALAVPDGGYGDVARGRERGGAGGLRLDARKREVGAGGDEEIAAGRQRGHSVGPAFPAVVAFRESHGALVFEREGLEVDRPPADMSSVPPAEKLPPVEEIAPDAESSRSLPADMSAVGAAWS